MRRIFGRDKPKMTKVTPAQIAPGPGVLEEHVTYQNSPHPQQRDSQQLQPRMSTRVSTDERWEVVSSYNDDNSNNVGHHRYEHRERGISDLGSPRPPALPTDSRSSSLTSLPPGASPPAPNAHPSPHPRSGSPFSVSTTATAVPASQGRARNDAAGLRKRPQATPGHTGSANNGGSSPPATAALGILRALDPFAAPDGAQGDREGKHNKHDHGHHPSEDTFHGEEKKERKSFWGGGRDREKDKERERESQRERDKYRGDDGSPAELTRMIGYLTATSSEDWSLVLEVCDRASESEANAKEAVKALRREFKYAEPPAQLSAARLWAIMLRNSSEIFMQQMVTKKFLETLEEVLTSSRTSPVVRERLMDVLAAVAYASQNKTKEGRGEKDGFRALWRRVKPADKPEEGVPFDIDDAMFNPPMPRPTSEYSLEHHQPYQLPIESQPLQQLQEAVAQMNPPQSKTARKKSQRRNRIIPVEEDIRRLFQECAMGNGNAQLLSQALAFARPEDLKKDVIREFHAKCRSSQELIFAQIPWASAGAERSRAAKGSPPPPLSQKSHSNGSYNGTHPRDDDAPLPQSTVEEDLLAALLESNEALLEALRLYDDLERVAVEKQAEEISRRDVRMDRRTLAYQEEYAGQLEPPYVSGASSSRTPSPSPTDSPALSFQQPAYIPSVKHPLPRIPNNLIPGSSPSPSLSPYNLQNGGLVPPPPAPHGPRSPALITASRTPSPERYSSSVPPGNVLPPKSVSSHTRTDSSASSKDHYPLQNGLDRLQIGGTMVTKPDDESSDDDILTPVRPSAKALGKRKVVEQEQADRAFDPDDMFFENRDDSYQADNRVDSDSDEVRWQQPTHFVYDAAAERTQQRIRRGRVSTLVDVVH